MLHHEHRIKGTEASDSSTHLSSSLNQLFTDGGSGGEALGLHLLKTLLDFWWLHSFIRLVLLLFWCTWFGRMASLCFCSLATTGQSNWHFKNISALTKEETVALPQKDVHSGGGSKQQWSFPEYCRMLMGCLDEGTLTSSCFASFIFPLLWIFFPLLLNC